MTKVVNVADRRSKRLVLCVSGSARARTHQEQRAFALSDARVVRGAAAKGISTTAVRARPPAVLRPYTRSYEWGVPQRSTATRHLQGHGK